MHGHFEVKPGPSTVAFVHPEDAATGRECVDRWVSSAVSVLTRDFVPRGTICISRGVNNVAWYHMPDGAPLRGGSTATATLQHKCARCEQVLDVPVVGEVHGRLDEALAAHQELCFRTGDHVRWEGSAEGNWIEGSVVRCADDRQSFRLLIRRASRGWIIGAETGVGLVGATLRRIPRPEQKGDEVRAAQARFQAEYEAAAKKLAENRIDPASWNPVGINAHIVTDSPHAKTITGVTITHRPIVVTKADLELEVRHDGVTLRDLLAAFEMLQRERHLMQYNAAGDLVRYGSPMPRWYMCQPGGFTPAQRAAVSAHWSAELRAKVAASKDAERRRVVVDLQDDDLEW
jgi:hypothetical protein